MCHYEQMLARILVTVGLAISLLFVGIHSLGAQEVVKIGIVDMQRAITESQAGKEAKKKFQAEVKLVESRLMEEKKEVERLKNDLDKRALLLKADEKRDMEKEFQRKYRNYQMNMRDSQEELRQKEKEMTGEIFKSLTEIIREIGKEENFTLIVERNQIPYADEGIDITEKVIKSYNGRSSGKASPGK